MKACTRCGVTKALFEFNTDKRAKSGTQSACKACQSAIRKQRREQDRAKAKEWREKNADKARAIWQRYAQRHKVKRLQENRESYWEDPQKYRAKAAQYRAENYDDVMRRNREREKRERENLGPVYVAKVLNMKREEVPAPLLVMKREQLLIRRLARQLRKAANESITNPG